MISNVYLHDHICDSAVARLRRHVNLVDNFDHPEELDAIIVRQQYCPREVISRAKRCRLIQMHGVGLPPPLLFFSVSTAHPDVRRGAGPHRC